MTSRKANGIAPDPYPWPALAGKGLVSANHQGSSCYRTGRCAGTSSRQRISGVLMDRRCCETALSVRTQSQLSDNGPPDNGTNIPRKASQQQPRRLHSFPLAKHSPAARRVNVSGCHPIRDGGLAAFLVRNSPVSVRCSGSQWGLGTKFPIFRTFA